MRPAGVLQKTSIIGFAADTLPGARRDQKELQWQKNRDLALGDAIEINMRSTTVSQQYGGYWSVTITYHKYHNFVITYNIDCIRP